MSFVERSIVIDTRFGAAGQRDLDHVLGEPLLFKGDDLSRTDVAPVVPRAGA